MEEIRIEGFKKAPSNAFCDEEGTEYLLNYRSWLDTPHNGRKPNPEVRKKLAEAISTYKLGGLINNFVGQSHHPVFGLLENYGYYNFNRSYLNEWFRVYKNTEHILLDHVLNFENGLLSAPYQKSVTKKETLGVYINSLRNTGCIVYAEPLSFKYHHKNTYPFVITYKVVELDELIKEFEKQGSWNIDEALLDDQILCNVQMTAEIPG